ncbi:MAG: virulence RhuM family protein [Tannerella sp.]|jgi:hypothetical protein|nr:virulence RhuM family protein [Tannerella sp.]
MERGYIGITENDRHEFSVEAKLVNGTLWLSQWEMADLFNVYTKTIESSLQSIFKSGILRQNDVTRIHTFEHEGRKCETTLYNLDALIAVSYRIASLEARAFREWVNSALRGQLQKDMPETKLFWAYLPKQNNYLLN